MEENGFLGSTDPMGTVGDLLGARKSRDLVTVPSSAGVAEVIGLLKLYGVSQLPVVEGDKLIGIISEKQLLERALTGDRSNIDVGSLAQPNYCTVDHDTNIAVLTDLFRRFKVAIVLEQGKPTNIITRIDLIDHISTSSKTQT
jgi:cystathionine beta-synthase